jgi:hypothetical protein
MVHDLKQGITAGHAEGQVIEKALNALFGMTHASKLAATAITQGSLLRGTRTAIRSKER